jgi:IS1 family transposase
MKTRKASGGVDIDMDNGSDVYLDALKEESERRQKGDKTLHEKIDSYHSELKSDIEELKSDSHATRKSLRGAKSFLAAVMLLTSAIGPELARWISSIFQH